MRVELKINMVVKHATCDSVLTDWNGYSIKVNPHTEYLVVDWFSKYANKCKCWVFPSKKFVYVPYHTLVSFIKQGIDTVVTDERVINIVSDGYYPSKQSIMMTENLKKARKRSQRLKARK